MAEDASLLRMDNLIVALLEATEDLDVLDVHGSQQLKGCHFVLEQINNTRTVVHFKNVITINHMIKINMLRNLIPKFLTVLIARVNGD